MVVRSAIAIAFVASLTSTPSRATTYRTTEDFRFRSIVEAELEAKIVALPHPAHWGDGGKVAIVFHVDEKGRVVAPVLVVKSRFDEIDRFAMSVVRSVALPPPPPLELKRGMLWSVTFDGRMPGPNLQLR